MISLFHHSSSFLRSNTPIIRKLSLSTLSNLLIVPYDEAEKNEVKSLGGRWDPIRKRWFVPLGEKIEKFEKWRTVYLNSKMEDKDEIKSLGAKYDPVTYKWYIKKDQRHLFSKWLDIPIESNLIDNKVLIMDLHTTGFPQFIGSQFPSYHNSTAYSHARLLSLNLIYSDINTFQEIERSDSIIKPVNFLIPNSQFHGITTELALSQGQPIHIVFQNFRKYLEKSKYIIAHNIEFDFNILKSELFRYHEHETLELLNSKIPLCSMLLSKDIFKLKQEKSNNFKSPSFKEFVEFTLHETLPKEITYTTNVDYLTKGLQVLAKSKQLVI